MKVAETKTSATIQRKAAGPFFKKSNGSFFGGEATAEQTQFFVPARSTVTSVNGQSIQAKLTIGQPNDKYEQEADTMADKVVQRLATPEVLTKKENAVQTKPFAATISPLVQRKCAACDEEEKLQKKDEEDLVQQSSLEIQRKPIFESNAEPGDDENNIQRKCAGCEVEKLVNGKTLVIRKSSVPIGEPNDQLEQDADKVAEGITGVPAPTAMSRLQRKESDNFNSTQVDTNLTSSGLSHGGAPLQDSVRNFYETKMGYDFSNVRIHTGDDAEQKSNALQAHAFTYGSHIWLGENQTPSDNFIMAHEMAHVVQQNKSTLQKKQEPGTAVQNGIPQGLPIIQRFIFWDALTGFSGTPVGGPGAHKELQDSMVNGSIISEAPIPNASRKAGAELGMGSKPLYGKADFYDASSKVGVNFVLPNSTLSCGITKLATPAPLRGATNDGNPRYDKKTGKISHISDGPANITLGEIKPAESVSISDGDKQLGFYDQGIKFAKDQVNCWSNTNPDKIGAKPQWPLNKVNRFDDATLPIPDQFKYSPSTMKADRNLGVVDFKGEEIKGKVSHVVVNPKKDLGKDVKGGFYAMHVGKGIIAYFYRPADLPGLISGIGLGPKSEEIKAYIVYATFLQDQVITPLFTGPEKAAPKRKDNAADRLAPKSKEAEKNNYRIQKVGKKAPKLKDLFDLSKWRGDHNKHQKNFKTQKKDTRNKLQFLELIYKTEGELKQAGIPDPVRKLPPKDDFEVKLGKKSPTDKGHEKNLTTLYSWMNLWAKEPIDFLGRFRARFGGTFVKIANKFNTLKKKLTDKFKKSKKSHSPTGKSYGMIAVRAFWEALIRAGGYVFENTVHLLVLSLESGLKEKLKTVIPVQGEDFQKMIDDGFPQLKEIQQTIETLENDFQKKIDEVVGKFDAEIATIKEIADEAKMYGNIIKAAMIAIQCGTPPGWGCLKLIASRLIAEAINEIMQWCWTQEQFDGILKSTGVLDSIPKKLAGYTADGIESALPGLLPLFDRSLFTTDMPLPEKIPCDKGPTDLHKAYAELDEEIKTTLGDEGYFLLLLAMEKYGVKSDSEFSAEEIREMRDRIPKDVNAEDLRRFLASDSKRDERIVFNIGEFLEKVRETRLPDNFTWYYVVHTPSQGHTSGEHVNAIVTISLAQSASQWTPIKKLEIPAKVIRRKALKKQEVNLQIFYLPDRDVVFNMFTNDFEIKADKEMWGYRPDIFRQE